MRIISIILLIVLLIPQSGWAKTNLSFATLSPKSTIWGAYILNIVRDVYKESEKEVLIRVYYGGVQGDENEMKDKIKLGQLNGGFFTGNGLGALAQEVRLLETPSLIQDYETANRVYQATREDFNVHFNKNGYELLSLVELGFAYFYSQKPLRSIADIRETKMWVWKGDAFANSLLKALRIPGVAVSFTEVLPSLQTGLIDGVYATPTALLSLEWQSQIKYMLDLPITLVSGGIVLDHQTWRDLSPAHQKIILSAIDKHRSVYRSQLHQKERESINVLKRVNVEILKSRDDVATLAAEKDTLLQQFPEDLRTRVLQELTP